MLKTSLKSFLRGFFRSVGKILAFLIIGALITFLSSFLNMGHVRALSNEYFEFYIGTQKINSTNEVIYVGAGEVNYITLKTTIKHDTSLEGKSITSVFDVCATGLLNEGYYLDKRVSILKSTKSCTVGGYNGVSYVITDTWNATNVLGYDEMYYISTLDDTLNAAAPALNYTGFYTVISYNSYFTGSSELKQLEEQQKTNEKLDATNNKLDDLNNNLTDSDTSGATSDFGNFFDSFSENDYSLSDVIKMPLQLISGLTSYSCTSLSIPLPFVDTTVELPCMTPIYQQFFGDIFDTYQLITTGMIAYWFCVNIFKVIKDLRDPEKDDIEVVEL